MRAQASSPAGVRPPPALPRRASAGPAGAHCSPAGAGGPARAGGRSPRGSSAAAGRLAAVLPPPHLRHSSSPASGWPCLPSFLEIAGVMCLLLLQLSSSLLEHGLGFQSVVC